MSTKQPQDRKPKATKSKDFTFTAGGVEYTLPPVATARMRLTGGDYEDAMMGGELGMMQYMVKVLRASDADPDTLTALRTLPQPEYLDVLQAWGEYGDGDGASLGE